MKIVFFSDSPHTISGFGTVSRNLATYFHNVGHDVHYIGWQTFGQQMVASFHDKILGFKLYPNVGGQKFGETAWKYWLPRIEPDLFFTLGDFWMLLDLFKQNEIPYPWLMYYPIDGYPITEQMTGMLKKLNYRVAMSHYGADMVKSIGLETGCITHGVETSNFKPLYPSVVRQMKQRLGIPPDAFVVGRVDRNQKRKMVPRTIKAFLPFKKDYPDSVLLLWMDRRDQEGWDLDFVCKRFGLEIGKDVFFPPQDMMANFMYGVPEEELAQVMNCIDIHCFLTGGEGFGLCVRADTIIPTDMGAFYITEDLIGANALSGDGMFHPILRRKTRSVDSYYEIKAQKCLPLGVSADHPFFATKASRYMINKYPHKDWLDWIDAEFLDVGDFVSIPIPKENDDLPIIDLLKFDDTLEYDDKFVWYKMGFSSKKPLSYSTIIKKLKTTKKPVENVIKHIRKGESMQSDEQQRIYEFLQEQNYVPPEPKKYPRFITINDDLLWLFGWYIAEGSGSDGAIEFSLGEQDEPHIPKILKTFKESFNDELSIIKKGKRIRLFASGKIYENFFKQWFGDGAHHKKIPQELMRSASKLFPLATGVMLGDGHHKERTSRLTTTSKTLVFQMWMILLANRILGSIRVAKNDRGFGGLGFVYELLLSGKSFYKFAEIADLDIIPPERTGSSEIFLEDYVLVPVRNIIKKEEKTTLYDIEIEGSHTFVGNGYLLHNTQLETMACGAVNVCTDYTTCKEVQGDWTCGIPVKVETFQVGNAGVDRALADVDDAYGKMKWLRENADEMKVRSDMGVERAREVYDWSHIVRQFDEWIRDNV